MKYFIVSFLILSLVLSGCVQQAPDTSMDSGPDQASATGTSIKEINVISKQYSFEPDPIEVNFGDKVKLKITTADVAHGFYVKEFGINETIRPGETAEVEFTADKKGSFTIRCSVMCGPGHSEMTGQLIVK